MKRTIIQIDEDACIGCRLCVDACHEGAIGMVDGKARLLRDDYCDGLGDCLPACPTGAITFVEREAAPYDEQAVQSHLAARAAAMDSAEDSVDAVSDRIAPAGCPGAAARSLTAERPAQPAGRVGGCPGAAARSLESEQAHLAQEAQACAAGEGESPSSMQDAPSRLAQWPVQIKLMPVQAPYYQGRGLLVAADCTAFSCATFHERFMKDNVTIIGCPKLDEGSYTEKLAAIIANNDVTSVTVARMEVPCCGGLERAVLEAAQASGKGLPVRVVTFSLTGDVLDDKTVTA